MIAEEAAERETPIAQGLNASPGAATGRVVFTADDAQEWASRGERVILVRRETTPDDYHGMIASQGILTSAGGTNSHAAVVARGEGIPAVCGADAIKLNVAAKTFSANGVTVSEGDVITIDGFTGRVYVGELPLEESILEKARAGDEEARDGEDLEGVRAADAPRRRGPPPARARERRHARPGDERARPRRRGHRPVPHRAHVPGRGARAGRAHDDLRGDAGGGAAGLRRAAAAPARRLRRHLHGDERAAGDGAAARPAPARVPARPGVARGRGRARPGARRGRRASRSACCRR